MESKYTCPHNPTPQGEQLKTEFKARVSSLIGRAGVNELMSWLDTTDFYYAPCSTRYHLSVQHGLLEHSLAVHDDLIKLCSIYPGILTEESTAILALFHDICKVHTYVPTLKNRKTGKKLANGRDEWESYIGYDFAEQFPYGHGEKSVIILSRFLELSGAESMAIRWHMGFSDASFKGGSLSVSNAMEMYPEIALLHSADLIATSRGK